MVIPMHSTHPCYMLLCTWPLCTCVGWLRTEVGCQRHPIFGRVLFFTNSKLKFLSLTETLGQKGLGTSIPMRSTKKPAINTLMCSKYNEHGILRVAI